jgi:hypothetical protein
LASTYYTWGKGTLKVYYGASLLLNVDFNFLDSGGYGEPNFAYIQFRNKDFSYVIPGDEYDALESVGIQAAVGWELRVAPAIQIKLIAGGAELMMEAPLYQSNGNEGVYRVLLSAGTLVSLFGDLYNSPNFHQTVEAEPLPYDCDFHGQVPNDVITVVNYHLNVEKISFLDDYQLYKDSQNTPPHNEPIIDPVWIRTSGKNDSIAYKKGSSYNMEIEVSNSYTPYHDFQYQIRGVAGIFSTGEYEGHMSGTDHNIISGILPIPGGRFADSVGVDSPTFYWVASKTAGFNFDDSQIITISGPHTIFLTYDKPRLDTVNVLALHKICHYAQNEYIDTLVAKSGVSGVYGEGWTYDPGRFIDEDPLNVIRNHIGQCGDYANLLVYLYEAVGIKSNGDVIFNGAGIGNNVYYFVWYDVPRADSTNLLSNWLTACDGTSDNWRFNYHAVAECVDRLCDASLGLFKPKSDYKSWWKYYVYPQALLPNPDDYLDGEPPPVPPYYYRHTLFVPPSVYPTNRIKYNTYHHHP